MSCLRSVSSWINWQDLYRQQLQISRSCLGTCSSSHAQKRDLVLCGYLVYIQGFTSGATNFSPLSTLFLAHHPHFFSSRTGSIRAFQGGSSSINGAEKGRYKLIRVLLISMGIGGSA